MENNEDFTLVDTRFPHIGKALREQWNTPALLTYIDHLLQDTRDHQRRGFPFEVVVALMNIHHLHTHLSDLRDEAPGNSDAWTDSV